jgi:hypothetical protein
MRVPGKFPVALMLKPQSIKRKFFSGKELLRL